MTDAFLSVNVTDKIKKESPNEGTETRYTLTVYRSPKSPHKKRIPE